MRQRPTGYVLNLLVACSLLASVVAAYVWVRTWGQDERLMWARSAVLDPATARLRRTTLAAGHGRLGIHVHDEVWWSPHWPARADPRYATGSLLNAEYERRGSFYFGGRDKTLLDRLGFKLKVDTLVEGRDESGNKISPAGAHSTFTIRDSYYGVPCWFVVFLTLALPLQRATGYWWRRRRLRHGWCPRCGYDLTANATGVCPECGGAVPAVSPTPAPVPTPASPPPAPSPAPSPTPESP